MIKDPEFSTDKIPNLEALDLSLTILDLVEQSERTKNRKDWNRFMRQRRKQKGNMKRHAPDRAASTPILFYFKQ